MIKTATYWISRDTNCAGDLAGEVQVWYRKPIRCKLGFDRGYAWMPSNPRDGSAFGPGADLGLYGSYSLAMTQKLFGVVPDTDLELIAADRNYDDAKVGTLPRHGTTKSEPQGKA